MRKNADRFVHAVFCDDIRREIGDKMSLMGCYQSELFVPFLPVVLPKLCVFVTISTPVNRPLKVLKIRLDQDKNQLALIEVSGDAMLNAIPQAEKDVTRVLANAGLVLSPLAIAAPGEIRVVVVTEEGEIIGPRLRIKKLPEQAATAAATSEATSSARKGRKAPAKKPAVRHSPSK